MTRDPDCIPPVPTEEGGEADWIIIESDGRHLTLQGPEGQEITVDTEAQHHGE